MPEPLLGAQFHKSTERMDQLQHSGSKCKIKENIGALNKSETWHLANQAGFEQKQHEVEDATIIARIQW